MFCKWLLGEMPGGIYNPPQFLLDGGGQPSASCFCLLKVTAPCPWFVHSVQDRRLHHIQTPAVLSCDGMWDLKTKRPKERPKEVHVNVSWVCCYKNKVKMASASSRASPESNLIDCY